MQKPLGTGALLSWALPVAVVAVRETGRAFVPTRCLVLFRVSVKYQAQASVGRHVSFIAKSHLWLKEGSLTEKPEADC